MTAGHSARYYNHGPVKKRGATKRAIDSLASYFKGKRYWVWVKGKKYAGMDCNSLKEFIEEGMINTKEFNVTFKTDERCFRRVYINYKE